MVINVYFGAITIAIVSNIWPVHGLEATLNETTASPTVKPVTNYTYQTSGFNSDYIKSGPILLIDKKTLFISNLNYDGSQEANFWAGTGTPLPNGTLVPDENNSSTALHSYTGRNIYVQLPGSMTTDRIDYLALWSIAKKNSLGHVYLYENASDEVRANIPEATGFHQRTKDNQTIFRVPKCCEPNEFLSQMCQPAETEVKIEYKVFPSNETHIDPDGFLENIKFVPYRYTLVCQPNYYRYFLEKNDTTFGLLYNSSLIYADHSSYGVLSHGQFCMDQHGNVTDNGETEIMIAVCGLGEGTTTAMLNLYFPFLIISTFCFFLSAFCYLIILKAKDVHQKCFVGYSSTMTVTFLCLVLLEKVNKACNFLGGLFFFSILCSFTWLACLCLNLVYLVKPFPNFSDKERFYIYFGSSLVIPIIFTISSFVPDGVPDIPRSLVKMYSMDVCSFKDANLALFFVPIGLLLLVSLVALCCTSWIISSNDNSRDYDWVRNKTTYKFMSRSCFLLWATTCIWLIEAPVSIINMDISLRYAIDLIEAMQGVFVVFIFVLNKYTRKAIVREIKRSEIQKEQEQQYRVLLKTLNKERDRANAGDRCRNGLNEPTGEVLELTEMVPDKGNGNTAK